MWTLCQEMMGCRLVGSWKANVLISFVLPLLLSSYWGCSEAPVVKVGDTAQDFTLPSLTGEQLSLSQFKGKNVFIFFWIEGCVFCETDNIVHVNDVFLKGKDKDLVVFSINIAQPKEDLKAFVKRKGLIFPVLLDRDGSVARKKYGVYMVPSLFIIGKDGLIKGKAYGYMSKDALWKFVNPYL